jgi:hypothetical protein
MHDRAIRTSCSSTPTTRTSAAAARTIALEQTWVGSVGGAELHRSHRMQPASLLVADTCRILQRERCMRYAEPGEHSIAGTARARRQRPGGGVAWENLGRVGSRAQVRFTPAQRAAPLLVLARAPGLTGWRLGCDTGRTINTMQHPRERRARTPTGGDVDALVGIGP